MDRALAQLKKAMEEADEKRVTVLAGMWKATPTQFAKLYLADMINKIPGYTGEVLGLKYGKLTLREKKEMTAALNKQRRRILRGLGTSRIKRKIGA
jgi:hypothetical protein